MRKLSLTLLLVSLILIGLPGCFSSQKPALPPTLPPLPAAATPLPTPAVLYEGDELAERLALREQIQPEAGVVANNRVEGLVQIHDFAEAYITALEDGTITLEELAEILQLAANARASLYNTGEPDMIQVSNTAGWILDLAVYGDWEMAESSIRKFQRSLPRKPSI